MSALLRAFHAVRSTIAPRAVAEIEFNAAEQEYDLTQSRADEIRRNEARKTLLLADAEFSKAGGAFVDAMGEELREMVMEALEQRAKAHASREVA